MINCIFFVIKNVSSSISVIPGLRDFSFFLSNTFVYEPILFRLSMNANIVKMQIFYWIKYDLRGHSRSQIMTLLIKNSPFLLFMLLIDWKNKVWLIQRRHFPCFDLNLRSYGQLFVLVFSIIQSNIEVNIIRKLRVNIYIMIFWTKSDECIV